MFDQLIHRCHLNERYSGDLLKFIPNQELKIETLLRKVQDPVPAHIIKIIGVEKIIDLEKETHVILIYLFLPGCGCVEQEISICHRFVDINTILRCKIMTGDRALKSFILIPIPVRLPGDLCHDRHWRCEWETISRFQILIIDIFQRMGQEKLPPYRIVDQEFCSPIQC